VAGLLETVLMTAMPAISFSSDNAGVIEDIMWATAVRNQLAWQGAAAGHFVSVDDDIV
jgi:hypothetical protein